MLRDISHRRNSVTWLPVSTASHTAEVAPRLSTQTRWPECTGLSRSESSPPPPQSGQATLLESAASSLDSVGSGCCLVIGIMFGTLFAANVVVQKGNLGLGIALYLAFTGVAGLFLSPILVQFTGEMIGVAFLLTAGLFVAMSAVGLTTKRDLSKLGPMLFIGLFGVIIISLINVFLLQSSVLFLLVNIVLLPIFLALTVWETKQMKELAQQAAIDGDDKAATQVAVIGSIGLYLNVLNMFIIILNLLGFLSGDD